MSRVDRRHRAVARLIVALAGGLAIGLTIGGGAEQPAWLGVVAATLLVMLLIWMDFKSFSRTLAAMAPLTVGLIWMAGWMVAADTPMNFINIFVTTMIIGIGVDYGVHILHRFQEVQDFSRERFEKGIVENQWTLRFALMWSGQAQSLKAGEYRFDRPLTALQVVREQGRAPARSGPKSASCWRGLEKNRPSWTS